MVNREQITYLHVVLPVLVVASIVGGVLLSIRTGDPECLKRAGALIAALGAGAILFQIAAEIRLEQQRSRIELAVEGEKVRSSSSATPLEVLTIRLALARLDAERSAIARRRLALAGWVIATAMIGEMLHGFGDLVMCSIFSVCD
jgi:hypothetical protein